MIFMFFFFYSYDEEAGKMDSGYPRSIEDDFPGIGDEVDAASYHYGEPNLVTSSQIPTGIYMQTECNDKITMIFSDLCLVRVWLMYPFFSPTGFLNFFRKSLQFEYSFSSRKVLRLLRPNSLLNAVC